MNQKQKTITQRQISKAIKGLSVGRDAIEIMKRVAVLRGKDVSDFDYVMEQCFYYNECFNIATASIDEDARKQIASFSRK